MTRYHGADDEDKWKLGSRVVEGLSGEALKVAMTFGFTRLTERDAVPKLIEEIRGHIFPMSTAEARELYRAGQRPGVLSRQSGEPMISYVQRRRRWWELLRRLDPKLSMSNTMLGEMLLDHSGLSHNERLMIMTSTFNNLEFDNVAEALIKQHALNNVAKDEGSSGQRKGKGKGKWRPRAYLASYDGEDDAGEYHNSEIWAYYGQDEDWQGTWDDWIEDPSNAWFANDGQDDWWNEYPDGYDDWEYTANLAPENSWHEGYGADDLTYEDIAMGYLSQDNNADDDELADRMQTAFLAGKGGKSGRFKGKGKFRFGKGKGKGFKEKFKGGKGKKGNPFGGGNLSLEDRRKRLQEFKSRTRCQACGQKGHWAGDKECPKASANLATMIDVAGDSSGDDGVSLSSPGRESTCMMAYGTAKGYKTTKTEGQMRKQYLKHENEMMAARAHRPPSPSPSDEYALIDAGDEFELPNEHNLAGVPGGDGLMQGDQYKGFTYNEVVLEDPEFCKWCMAKPHKSLDLQRFQAWLRSCFVDSHGTIHLKNPQHWTAVDLQTSEKKIVQEVPLESRCVGGCKAFDRRGTNAYFEVKTCKVCGFRTKTKKDAPKTYEPDQCPHAITDKRGSSSSMSRIWCMQCNTFISEMPQELRRERNQIAKAVASSNESVVRAANNLQEQALVKLEKGEALACLEETMKRVRAGGPTIRATDLIKELQDCVDGFSERASTALVSVCYQGKEDDQPMMPVRDLEGDLRVVDLLEDEGIWAVLDEGCNTTCHSKAWRLNAEEKYLKMGYCVEWQQADKEYHGVGDRPTKASSMYLFPFSVDTTGYCKGLSGVVESFELDHQSFVPLLLSLGNQATLGLIKDMRAGKVWLSDYGDMELELCRAAQNGLLCVNIGRLDLLARRTKLPRNIRAHRIGSVEFQEKFVLGDHKCNVIDSDKLGQKVANIAKDSHRVKWHDMVDTDIEDSDKRIGHEHVDDDDDDMYASDAYQAWKLQFDEHVSREENLSAAVYPQVSAMMAPKVGERIQNMLGPYLFQFGIRDLEDSKLCQERNGRGSKLTDKQKWITSFLHNSTPGRYGKMILGTKAGKALENVVSETLEWHFCLEYKKIYHQLMPQRNSTWLFLDTRPFESTIDPLRDVPPHIAGRAVTQAIEHHLEAIGNLFYDLGKKIKGHMIEHGCCTGLCVAVSTDTHCGISHMVSLFLCSAIKEQSEELKEGTQLTHLTSERYKYDCKTCHEGQCKQCSKYKDEHARLYKKLAKKLKEGYQSVKGAIIPPEDHRRITPQQKAKFEKREAAAGWKKPPRSKFQLEEEEEEKRRLRNPGQAEEQERAMKSQYQKMQDELQSRRGRSPETKETAKDRKRGRDPSMAPSASGVSKRKLDVGALETVMNTLTDDEVMKLATKFSVAGITEEGVGVNLLFDPAYSNLGSTPKQRVFSVCKAAGVGADSVRFMAGVTLRTSPGAHKATASKESVEPGTSGKKRKESEKEDNRDEESSPESIRESFEVIRTEGEHPDWGDDSGDDAEVIEDPQKMRDLKSQTMESKKSPKTAKEDKKKAHHEEEGKPAHKEKSELESSSDYDKREDRERGPSRSGVVLRENRERSRSPVVLKSSQDQDAWYKPKGKSKGKWMKKVDQDEVSKTFKMYCEDKKDDLMAAKRNRSVWETFEIAGQQLSCKVTLKIKPRHSRVDVPVSLQHWKKWTWTYELEKEAWSLQENDTEATSETLYEEDSPNLAVIFLLDPQAVRQGSAFMATSTSVMGASSRGLFEDGVLRVEASDRMMAACLTSDTSRVQYDGALLQGLEEHVVKRKQEEGLSNKGLTGLSKVGLVLFLGSMFCFQPVDALVPEGLDVQHVASMDDLPKFEKWHFAKFHPSSVVICSTGGERLLNEVAHTLELKGGNTVYITPQWGWDHETCALKLYDTPVWHGPGDITLRGDDNESLEMFKDWASRKVRFKTPMTWEDAGNDPGFMKVLEQQKMEANVAAAFPAEAEEDELDMIGSLDLPENGGEDEPPVGQAEDEERRPRTVEEMEGIFEQEEEMLESIPLPNMPKDEKERREAWLKLPRKARLAVRKLHRQFGHCPPRTLVEILRASGAKPEYVQAARTMRCDGCDAHKQKAQTSKSALPRSYGFNISLGIDIFEVKDSNGQRYSVLNLVCLGTTFQQAILVREGGGQLPSSQCYELFETHWAQWAGYPKEVISDRGLHNRGSFAKSLSARGIQVINVGVEAPEQIGRVERHGGILKSMVLKVASDLGVSGIEEMKAVVAQCVRQKNSMSRKQGFSPTQWVLGRSPREPGTVMDEESWSDLGSLQLATDESHEFGKMCKIREAARHAFVKADMGSRVSRAILRKAAPVSKEYQCGDLVCYKTQQGGWSTASRVIGFDGPKIVWVIHRGVPVCVGLDKLRPVNASEALAHQYLHGQKPFQFGSRHQQQGYVDARLDNPEVEEPARPAARPNDPEEDETLAEEFADRPSEGRRVRFGTAEEPDVEEIPELPTRPKTKLPVQKQSSHPSRRPLGHIKFKSGSFVFGLAALFSICPKQSANSIFWLPACFSVFYIF